MKNPELVPGFSFQVDFVWREIVNCLFSFVGSNLYYSHAIHVISFLLMLILFLFQYDYIHLYQHLQLSSEGS